MKQQSWIDCHCHVTVVAPLSTRVLQWFDWVWGVNFLANLLLMIFQASSTVNIKFGDTRFFVFITHTLLLMTLVPSAQLTAHAFRGERYPKKWTIIKSNLNSYSSGESIFKRIFCMLRFVISKTSISWANFGPNTAAQNWRCQRIFLEIMNLPRILRFI